MTSSGKKWFFMFMADTSGSMYGEKIAAVNAAVAECMNEIRRIGDGNSEVYFYSFDEGVKEVGGIREFGGSRSASSVNAPSFLVEANANGFYRRTSYAALYKWLGNAIGVALPARLRRTGEEVTLCLFLLTDGKPSDSEEYVGMLEYLKQRDLYREAVRYAALVGQQGNTAAEPILKFVDNKMDRIIPLSDLPGEIAKMKSQFSADNGGGNDRNAVYQSIFG